MKIKAPIKRPTRPQSDLDQNNGGLSSKDFVSGQEVRWCPGCGDYSILKQMQTILPQIGIEKKDVVFIS
ncbi:MAG: hypothetical protein KAQ62_19650, partial [Cyclobacteriaceae bacterium]|nr:hypothetical protein [Cyclobacteriaceae bacterium]